MDNEFGRISPADNAFDITADTNVPVTKGIYVGATGNVRVKMAGGAIVTFVDLQGGIVHPLRITRVYGAATTATGLIGLV